MISLSVDTEAEILENECKLEDLGGSIVANPADLNEGPPQPIRWTNNVIWTRAVTKWDAVFNLPKGNSSNNTINQLPNITLVDHYVKDYRFGIMFGSTILRQIRGKTDILFIIYSKFENSSLDIRYMATLTDV